MARAVWVNGQAVADAAHAIAYEDRGFGYGDGLFETALLHDGAVRFLSAHLQRLRESCARLGIAYPGDATLAADIRSVSGDERDGIVKIIVTRGAGGRGYRPLPNLASTRVVALHPPPVITANSGLTVRWCDIHSSRNAALAGMKHLNRLENVLAQMEWDDAAIGEGLLLDTEGELVSATSGNIFIARYDALFTPDLRYCGVRGVMRGQVLRAAAELGVSVSEEPLWPHDLEHATEVFVTSAVRGIRPVIALESLQWEAGPLARKLNAALGL